MKQKKGGRKISIQNRGWGKNQHPGILDIIYTPVIKGMLAKLIIGCERNTLHIFTNKVLLHILVFQNI